MPAPAAPTLGGIGGRGGSSCYRVRLARRHRSKGGRSQPTRTDSQRSRLGRCNGDQDDFAAGQDLRGALYDHQLGDD